MGELDELTVEVHLPATRSDLAVVRLSGILNSYSLQDLEKTMQELLEENRHHIIVNCQKLKFVSSSGMGVFLGTLGEVEKQGGSITFAQVTEPEVHDAMNLLGFFEVFPLYEQESEAIQKCQPKR